MRHGQFYTSMYFTITEPVHNPQKGKWESTVRCKNCKKNQRIANACKKTVENKAKSWTTVHICSSA